MFRVRQTSTVLSAPYLGAVVQRGFTLSPRNGWKRAGTQPGAPVAGTGQCVYLLCFLVSMGARRGVY